MGICASVPSSIHNDTYGHENAAHYSQETNGSPVFGSVYSHTGTKGLNQDCAILFQDYGVEDGVFCGVFDGHGRNGHIVSELVRDRLPNLLLSQRNDVAEISLSGVKAKGLESDHNSSTKDNFLKWKEACLITFGMIDKEIKLVQGLDCSCSGTTATIVAKQGELLVIANLGDSRAVLGTRTESGIVAIQLTTDLKPGVPSEAERIRKCKGRVLAVREEPDTLRVWLPYDDIPGLAMSRAFGDFILKNHGVIAIPDVSYHHLSPNDQFLVLATDGVWDILGNEQVINIVSSTAKEDRAAKAVVDAATCMWKKKHRNSRRDDCTVICLFFHKTQLLRQTPQKIETFAYKTISYFSE